MPNALPPVVGHPVQLTGIDVPFSQQAGEDEFQRRVAVVVFGVDVAAGLGQVLLDGPYVLRQGGSRGA